MTVTSTTAVQAEKPRTTTETKRSDAGGHELPSDSIPGRDLSIGEVSARTGLSARTVRYYEEVGLLPEVRRRSGGRRVYGEDELERLRFIGRLKTLGLSLSEIKELNDLYAHAGSTRDVLMRLHAQLGEHLNELASRIEALSTLRDQMSSYRTHVAGRLEDPADRSADPRQEKNS